ncbi:hypothetical protein [Micromonospora ureilytica]|uniref:hypothetical protein n=1 Tax=Micromonospora ureilytica TaxID=709868 RepID=UPI00197BE76B|nr:hypothetical protein [Micromonospora ureilytica]
MGNPAGFWLAFLERGILGSIKWLESQRFDRHDYDRLVCDMLTVPGVDPAIPLVAVSRSGIVDGLPIVAHWGPDDLVGAWQA